MTRAVSRKSAPAGKASGKRKSRIAFLDPAIVAGQWKWVWRSGKPSFRSLLKPQPR